MARQEHHLKKSKNSAILPRKHARAHDRDAAKVRVACVRAYTRPIARLIDASVVGRCY